MSRKLKPISILPEVPIGDLIVGMVIFQQRANPFQRLTLPQVYARLPAMTLGQYHDELRALQDAHRIRLGPYTQALATLDDPRNALYLDREVKYYLGIW